LMKITCAKADVGGETWKDLNADVIF